MKITCDPLSVAAIFAQLSGGKVSTDEFMAARTPQEVDELTKKAGIPDQVVHQIYDAYAHVQGSLKDGFIELDFSGKKGPQFN